MSHGYDAQQHVISGANAGPGLGRTNERIGRIQETYVANATTSWLESLERSLAQMKDYQVLSPVHVSSNILIPRSPPEKSWRVVVWPTMLLWPRCKRPKKKTSKWKKNYVPRKPSTKKPTRKSIVGCRMCVTNFLDITMKELMNW